MQFMQVRCSATQHTLDCLHQIVGDC